MENFKEQINNKKLYSPFSDYKMGEKKHFHSYKQIKEIEVKMENEITEFFVIKFRNIFLFLYFSHFLCIQQSIFRSSFLSFTKVLKLIIHSFNFSPLNGMF